MSTANPWPTTVGLIYFFRKLKIGVNSLSKKLNIDLYWFPNLSL